jgi:hypothetical protein
MKHSLYHNPHPFPPHLPRFTLPFATCMQVPQNTVLQHVLAIITPWNAHYFNSPSLFIVTPMKPGFTSMQGSPQHYGKPVHPFSLLTAFLGNFLDLFGSTPMVLGHLHTCSHVFTGHCAREKHPVPFHHTSHVSPYPLRHLHRYPGTPYSSMSSLAFHVDILTISIHRTFLDVAPTFHPTLCDMHAGTPEHYILFINPYHNPMECSLFQFTVPFHRNSHETRFHQYAG